MTKILLTTTLLCLLIAPALASESPISSSKDWTDIAHVYAAQLQEKIDQTEEKAYSETFVTNKQNQFFKVFMRDNMVLDYNANIGRIVWAIDMDGTEAEFIIGRGFNRITKKKGMLEQHFLLKKNILSLENGEFSLAINYQPDEDGTINPAFCTAAPTNRCPVATFSDNVVNDIEKITGERIVGKAIVNLLNHAYQNTKVRAGMTISDFGADFMLSEKTRLSIIKEAIEMGTLDDITDDNFMQRGIKTVTKKVKKVKEVPSVKIGKLWWLIGALAFISSFFGLYIFLSPKENDTSAKFFGLWDEDEWDGFDIKIPSDERLKELQELSFQDYLSEKEWLKIRKAAIEKSQQFCQACLEQDYEVRVYHRDIKCRGREKPRDLMVLCDACRVKHKIKDALSIDD